MLGRIVFRLLLFALSSKGVQKVGQEVLTIAAKKTTAYLLKQLKSGNTFKD